jgi:hypothetical protein
MKQQASDMSNDYKQISERMEELRKAYPDAGIDTNVTTIVHPSNRMAVTANAKVTLDGKVLGSGSKFQIADSDLDQDFVGWAETIAVGRAIAFALKDDRKTGKTIHTLEEALAYQEKLKWKLWNHFNNGSDRNQGIIAATENILNKQTDPKYKRFCMTQIQLMKNPSSAPAKDRIKKGYGW